VDLEITFDLRTKRTRGRSRIEFFSEKAGYPMLDLVPNSTSVTLNGKSVGQLELVTPPGGETKLRVVPAEVDAISFNLLEIEYEVPAEHVTYSGSGVRIGFFMSDVGQDRDFLEQYAPSNLEF